MRHGVEVESVNAILVRAKLCLRRAVGQSMLRSTIRLGRRDG
ncbi:MAG: hypothetical protein AVDCRST_MAG19-812 [uncultured Thermomicrobiales bacterium]|uniref:Uncharacterized protein n=1 Tax=uncultured Thermomicrobiales bacterium TaxID=1645740 RepID=A0A6J4ULE7_9BACT|nr:MAG: hypothetical protein AVDCRST_MAG19-812 [uncultured Thermomicrobiales bacterium]